MLLANTLDNKNVVGYFRKSALQQKIKTGEKPNE
jgi:hypothetical protein